MQREKKYITNKHMLPFNLLLGRDKEAVVRKAIILMISHQCFQSNRTLYFILLLQAVQYDLYNSINGFTISHFSLFQWSLKKVVGQGRKEKEHKPLVPTAQCPLSMANGFHSLQAGAKGLFCQQSDKLDHLPFCQNYLISPSYTTMPSSNQLVYFVYQQS